MTPLAAGVGATVTVDGEAVPNGTESAPISLAVGLNYIDVEVTADDGTTRMYTVEVKRLVMEPSHNATLAGLTISDGELDPVFNGEMYTSYTAEVPYTTNAITVTPSVAGIDATVTVNGTAIPSGSASGEISLGVDVNIIEIVVTAADGITSKTYIIEVTRLGPEYTASYTVASGEVITEGDIVKLVNGELASLEVNTEIDAVGVAEVFESTFIYFTSVTTLSPTKAIVTYQDEGDSGYGTACVLEIDGTTITPGPPIVFTSAYTYYNASVTALSSSKAIVTYNEHGNSDYGTACVLEIDGTTITPGTPVVLELSITWYNASVTALSSTKAIVTYKDSGNSNYGTACVLEIDGSTITPGTPVVFESASTSFPSVTALSSNKAIVTYRDAGNSSYGTACVLEIDGTTITPGTPAVFESANTGYISVTALSSSKALVTYEDGGNSDYGTACVLEIDGSTITPGTPVVFESAGTTHISATALSSSKALVTYEDGGNSDYGTACLLEIDGTTIAPGTPVVFESANTGYTSVTALSSSKALVTYEDVGNSNYGTACVLQSNSSMSDIIGIAKESKNGGELCEVAEFDQSSYIYDLPGLTAGEVYYCGYNGQLTTEKRANPPHPAFEWFDPVINFKVGNAISDSAIEVIGVYE